MNLPIHGVRLSKTFSFSPRVFYDCKIEIDFTKFFKIRLFIMIILASGEFLSFPVL